MATASGVKMAELEETKRHNQASLNEHLGATLGSGAIGALGRVGAAAIKRNDPELYKRLISLFDTSANLPFPVKKGRTIAENYTPDSVIAIHRWVPTIGTQYHVTVNAPIMIAAKELFATIRGKNSGSVNYDATDLMQVNLAIDSVLTTIDESMRALRVANRTEDLNPATRANIVTNLGYSITDLTRNKDRWLNVINKAIENLNTLSLPGGLSYFQKHRYLANWILTEKDKQDGQYKRTTFHAFKVEGYFVYDEENGELDFTDPSVGLKTSDKLEAELDAMLTPLINSDAVSIMAGDIENAVNKGVISESAIIKLTPYSLDDIKADPYNYDKDMLMQIRNATIVGRPYQGQLGIQFSVHQAQINGMPYIYQGELDGTASVGPKGIRINNPGNGLSSVTIGADGIRDRLLGGKVILITSHDCPTPDEVIESTRLQAFTTVNEARANLDLKDAEGLVFAHGSELILSSRIYYYSSLNDFKRDTMSYIEVTGVSAQNDFSQVTLINNLIHGMKYFPIIRLAYYENLKVIPCINYENYNYRPMVEDELDPLHECALRSEFAFEFSANVNKDATVSKSDTKDNGKKFNNNGKDKRVKANKNRKFNKGKDEDKKDKDKDSKPKGNKGKSGK